MESVLRYNSGFPSDPHSPLRASGRIAKSRVFLELDSRPRELRISRNSIATLNKCKALRLSLHRRLSILHAVLFIPQSGLHFGVAAPVRIGHQLTHPRPKIGISLGIVYFRHCLNQRPIMDSSILIHTLCTAKIPVYRSLHTRSMLCLVRSIHLISPTLLQPPIFCLGYSQANIHIRVNLSIPTIVSQTLSREIIFAVIQDSLHNKSQRKCFDPNLSNTYIRLSH